MKRSVLILFFVMSCIVSFAQKDTTLQSLTDASKLPADSNILIVVDGNVLGTLRELKTDIRKKFPVEIIERIDVLKGQRAIDKYGDKGKGGVIEFTLKGVMITDITIADPSSPADNSVLSKVDIEASFPGGDMAWRRLLERNLNANVPVDHGAPEGTYTVIVQFIVEKDGSISDIKALTNHGYGMEEEVVKLISKSPNWTPGIYNGRIVRAYRKQPVTFQITSEFDISPRTIKAGEPTTIEIKELDYMKDDEIEVTISSGTVSHVSGKKYTVTVDKPGKVLLTVSAKGKKKKDNYEIGKVEVTVQ